MSSVLGQARVTGVVVDADTREPLPGANVFIDGGTQGTATDDRGRFRLTGLKPGQYAVVASMVGYEMMSISVVVGDSSQTGAGTQSLRFELRPDPVDLEGVTVEGSREKWLKRLDEFRKAFFGTVSNAEKCSFVNPEVLAFEENGDALVAHAERPLRIRNEALGYELTYHLSHYTFNPGGTMGRRLRFGPVEFDTLEAQSPALRRAWREARRKTYRGSFDHFIDALRANTFRDEGFKVRITERISDSKTVSRPRRVQGGRWRGRAHSDTRDRPVTDPDKIFTPMRVPGQGLLSAPEAGDLIRVTYTREEESQAYARTYRQRAVPWNRQTSWIQLVGNRQVLIDVKTGDFLSAGPGHYLLRGYWGWEETAATELPGTYRPLGASP